MQITVNGKPQLAPEGSSLRVYLESLRLPALEQGVAVAVNGRLVRRADWAEVRLSPHDELEIVQASQGG